MSKLAFSAVRSGRTIRAFRSSVVVGFEPLKVSRCGSRLCGAPPYLLLYCRKGVDLRRGLSLLINDELHRFLHFFVGQNWAFSTNDRFHASCAAGTLYHQLRQSSDRGLLDVRIPCDAQLNAASIRVNQRSVSTPR